MTAEQLRRHSESQAPSESHAQSFLRVPVLLISALTLLAVMLQSGCAGSAMGNSAAAPNAEVAASATLAVNSSVVAFGNVPVGSATNQSLNLTNSGSAAVTISKVSVSGADFSLQAPSLPLTLYPGNSFTFALGFTPTATGNAAGTASIASAQMASPLTIQVNGTGMAVAPVITSQSASQSVLAGQSATFSVTASGTAPLSYQWRKNDTAINGATSSSYTTPSTSSSDNGAQFSVVVSNSAGSVTNSFAPLSVDAVPVAPSIVSQPANQTAFAGQTATFSVVASGTAPMSYQWQKNGASISGATSSSYTTPAETTSASGTQFTVKVRNSAGTVTSSAAVLTVNPDPVSPTISAQPASETITAGQTATFSVVASGTAPISYQWQKNGTSISGAASSSYTTPAETTSTSGAQFTVLVSNTMGSITSSPATLTVVPPPSPLTLSTSTLTFGNVNVGSSKTLSVTFTNAGAANVAVSKVSVSGPGFSVSGLSAGAVFTPGATATLNAVFAPAATGGVTGSVLVVSNASNSSVSITLSGTGVEPSHSATLAWNPSTSTVIGYNVYRGAVSGGPYSKLSSSVDAATSFTDMTVGAGQTYYWVVTAVNSSNVESTYSNEVSATIPTP